MDIELNDMVLEAVRTIAVKYGLNDGATSTLVELIKNRINENYDLSDLERFINSYLLEEVS